MTAPTDSQDRHTVPMATRMASGSRVPRDAPDSAGRRTLLRARAVVELTAASHKFLASSAFACAANACSQGAAPQRQLSFHSWQPTPRCQDHANCRTAYRTAHRPAVARQPLVCEAGYGSQEPAMCSVPFHSFRVLRYRMRA